MTALADQDPSPVRRAAALAAPALTLAFGIGGGLVAVFVGLPLPWMLGAMAATAAASFSGLRQSVNPTFRNVMLTVLGVLLGASFTADLIAGFGANLLAVSLLVPYTAFCTFFIFVVLSRTTALDRPTAFFSSVPGGVNEMTLMGTERGGREASLAVHHSIRLFFIVVCVSLSFVLLSGYVRPGLGAIDLSLLPLSGYAEIAAMGAAGAVLGRVLRLPASYLLGPMVVSAAVHVTGLSAVRPDYLLVALAQLVSGAAMGSRFSDFDRRDLVTAVATALKISAILLALTVAYVLAVQPLIGRPFGVALLAYAPGGLAEMGLIALTMGEDAAFVSIMQVGRFFVVVTLAVPLYRAAVFLAERRRPH